MVAFKYKNILRAQRNLRMMIVNKLKFSLVSTYCLYLFKFTCAPGQAKQPQRLARLPCGGGAGAPST